MFTKVGLMVLWRVRRSIGLLAVVMLAGAGPSIAQDLSFDNKRENSTSMVARDNDDLGNSDIGNNGVEKSVKHEIDLALVNIEIAGPYTLYPQTADRAAYRSLPFLVTVENTGRVLASPRCVLATRSLLHIEDASGDQTMTTANEIESDIPSLEPGEQVTVETTVDVQLNSAGTVDGTTHGEFNLDPNGDTNDPHRSNNAEDLVITNESFRPDYQAAIMTVGGDPGSYLNTRAKCIVRNLGYEAATGLSRATFTMNGNVRGRAGVPALGVAEFAELQFPVSYDIVRPIGGWTFTYTIDTDTRNNIEESNEDNNDDEYIISRSLVKLTPDQIGLLVPGEFIAEDYVRLDAHEFPEIVQQAEFDSTPWLREFGRRLQDESSPRPIYQCGADDWVIQFNPMTNTMIVMSPKHLYW